MTKILPGKLKSELEAVKQKAEKLNVSATSNLSWELLTLKLKQFSLQNYLIQIEVVEN